MEDDLNSLRDKLAAATFELQWKEDKIKIQARKRLMSWLVNMNYMIGLWKLSSRCGEGRLKRLGATLRRFLQ
jgi:hypothetical protein